MSETPSSPSCGASISQLQKDFSEIRLLVIALRGLGYLAEYSSPDNMGVEEENRCAWGALAVAQVRLASRADEMLDEFETKIDCFFKGEKA
ncbi:hypothetical protein AGMMS50256_25810 [Betaproteobacteria bacterium]|nr:hypothetical protein AGMMS50256_25810 [Betaproteobacteria bacterium]